MLPSAVPHDAGLDVAEAVMLQHTGPAVIITCALATQLLPSVALTPYCPGAKPLTLFPIMPLLQLIIIVPVPPKAVAVAVPSASPAQVSSVNVVVKVGP